MEWMSNVLGKMNTATCANRKDPSNPLWLHALFVTKARIVQDMEQTVGLSEALGVKCPALIAMISLVKGQNFA